MVLPVYIPLASYQIKVAADMLLGLKVAADMLFGVRIDVCAQFWVFVVVWAHLLERVSSVV